jgi:acyl-CoA synthetase (NDP forming)
MHLVRHRRNREALMQVPSAAIAEGHVDEDRVAAILDAARAAGRGMLTAPEALELIAAYGIPTPQAGTPAPEAEVLRARGLAAGISRDPQFGSAPAGRRARSCAMRHSPCRRSTACSRAS